MVTYLFLALLIAIIIWRVILPGMKLESGKASSTGDPTASVTPPVPKTGWRKRVNDNWWKVLLMIIVTAMIVWGLKSTLGTSSGPGTWSSLLQFTPKGVWELFKGYWFWIVLILAGLFFGFGAAAKSKPWAKAVQGMVILIAITLAGAMAVHGIWGEAETPKLSMSAYGESQRVKPPIGRAVTITSGTGYTLHYVYADGRTGTFGDPSSPKESGHIVGVYARDTSGKANLVTYEFVRP